MQYRKRRRKDHKRGGFLGKNLLFFIACLTVAGLLSQIPTRQLSLSVFQRKTVSVDGLVDSIEKTVLQESSPEPMTEAAAATVAENSWTAPAETEKKTENAVWIPAVNKTETAEKKSDLSGVDLGQYVSPNELDNGTDYSVDIQASAREELSFQSDSPRVLIIHTHGSECYEPDAGESYQQTDPWRTADTEYNMIHIGDIVADELESRGIPVLHDRNLYDYPGYNGSYTRSMEAISDHLTRYSDIELVLDLHRDANDSGYSTVQTVDGQSSAQVMLIVGTDFAGLEHPSWRENFTLAAHLQGAMNALYPGLARELCISQYRYNQQATRGSLIAEIGYNCNKLSEAETAARFFAHSVCAVLQ